MTEPEKVSKARINFEEATWDVYHLFDIHDELVSKINVPKKKEKANILVRSTYLFITACWESYVEDLCDEALSFLLRKTIKGRNWISGVLKKHKKDLIHVFNTPRSKNINELYLATIGLTNLSNSWRWRGMTTSQSQSRLGNYIDKRGAIAHRTKTSQSISRKDSEEYLELIKILVNKTERHVQSYVKRITGMNFGEKGGIRIWLGKKK